MKNKKVLKVVTGIALVLALLTGCAGSNGADAAKETNSTGAESTDTEAAGAESQETQNGNDTAADGATKEVNIGVTSFADTLEPTEQYFSWVVTRYGVGETLVRFDEEGELAPCLAENWEVSDDQLTWNFKIREGVLFSNGTEMTPELVKASLERTFSMNDRAGSSFFTYEAMEIDEIGRAHV